MKNCVNCGHFKAYYTKGYAKFEKSAMGYCTKHNLAVQKHEGCENWCNYAVRRNIRKAICLKALDIALSNLSEIKQILEEENEERQAAPVAKK